MKTIITGFLISSMSGLTALACANPLVYKKYFTIPTCVASLGCLIGFNLFLFNFTHHNVTQAIRWEMNMLVSGASIYLYFLLHVHRLIPVRKKKLAPKE
ncbi:hypothetical protein SH580_02920 [Coraliomargarita algicola]|uniref:Uncharacterized protein n=1 Tax=Coraliomargarita algicola TaxID=3092156 RepID=A0ABZ0RN45_9BACT|nr:hypothetical protein [Coraliomargarita sp. J2-16]WPJ96654.1 hypothetical protein SH580_02920 [Coraliomargarita sp. J2-16]